MKQPLKRVSITEFKQNFLEFINQIEKGAQYLITRRGNPIVRAFPPIREKIKTRRGSIRGLAKIHGEII